jgi:hypothetical protein
MDAQTKEAKLKDNQIVRLLLESAMECGRARVFVAGLKNRSVCQELQQIGRKEASWLRDSDTRKRANESIRSNFAASAAVILKWVNDGD